jgi:hypothetical protein
VPDEFDLALPKEAPIRQGDVIGFWDWSTRKPTERFGLVITADCDIAQERAFDSICYLRIIPVPDYLHLFWAPRMLVANRRKWLRVCAQDAVSIFGARETTTTFSADIVEQLVAEGRLDQVRQKLLECAVEREHRLIKRFGLVDSLFQISPALGSDCFTRLIDAEHIWREAGDRVETLGRLNTAARNHLRGNPQSVAFIRSIPEIDEVGGSPGYAILLDQMNVWPLNSITFSFDVARQKPNEMAYRLGRLSDRYKYAVIQQFAYLFQRIGLPDEHQVALDETLGTMTLVEEG